MYQLYYGNQVIRCKRRFFVPLGFAMKRKVNSIQCIIIAKPFVQKSKRISVFSITMKTKQCFGAFAKNIIMNKGGFICQEMMLHETLYILTEKIILNTLIMC